MPKKKQDKAIELAQQTKTSVISVSREYQLNLDIINPKTSDELYATVPEIFRTVNLRGSAMIYRGYEIEAVDDSQDAKYFANVCAHILKKSGGVDFIEQLSKNADLYGNAYVELVKDGGKIVELAHVHPYNFGYEVEVYYDEKDSKNKTRVKIDNDTQKPIGYASYKYDETNEIYVTDQKIPLEDIAHLKYNVIGDAFYGVSIIQPMFGSILRKLKIEADIESAARLVSSPKIVISGEFDSDEAAREEAKEAASLDVNDVVILQNGKEFKFVNPGDTNLPELREIFLVNITTASGIPRPILTSEGTSTNKAILHEMMISLRETMKSNTVKIKNMIETQIFNHIGETYGISDYQKIIPRFLFPEDVQTEAEIIQREEKKAATLTSLSNSLQILNNTLANLGEGSDVSDKIKEAMAGTAQLYINTVHTFLVDEDQTPSKIEEETPEEMLLSRALPEADVIEGETTTDIYETISGITLIDEDVESIRQPNRLLERHDLMHKLFEEVLCGAEIFDIETGALITIHSIAQKHKYYLMLMEEYGIIHDPSDIGSELDFVN